MHAFHDSLIGWCKCRVGGSGVAQQEVVAELGLCQQRVFAGGSDAPEQPLLLLLLLALHGPPCQGLSMHACGGFL